MGEMRTAFGVAVRVARTRRTPPMPQWELAQLAGMDRAQVSRIETGQVDPKLSVQQALAQALGLTVDELLRQAREELERENERRA